MRGWCVGVEAPKQTRGQVTFPKAKIPKCPMQKRLRIICVDMCLCTLMCKSILSCHLDMHINQY